MSMPPNPFLEPEAIGPWIEDVASRLAKVSTIFPASSQTDSSSYYSAAPGMDVATTQDALLVRTAVVCVAARVLAFDPNARLTADLILDMHRGIFEPVFGDETLGFRAPPARGEHRLDDGVGYPIWILKGSTPELVPRFGAESKQVLKRVRKACRAFEELVPFALNDRDESALAIAQLYVRLIRIHPFADGNGRTAWAALQFAAGRLGFPLVQSTPTLEARVALGDAIRNGNKIDRLVEHIVNATWEQ